MRYLLHGIVVDALTRELLPNDLEFLYDMWSNIRWNCYIESEKKQIMDKENNKEHANLTWFTKRVLATSTGKEREKFYCSLIDSRLQMC